MISKFVLQVKLHPVKHRPGNHPGNVVLSREPKFQVADKLQFCIIYLKNFCEKVIMLKKQVDRHGTSVVRELRDFFSDQVDMIRTLCKDLT